MGDCKGTPQLKARLDDFAARHKIGTSSGNQILMRYLKNVKYVKNAASERSEEVPGWLVFPEVRRPVRRRLDDDGRAGLPGVGARPECKKPVGAIGVMQVMPATGKDRKVGDTRRTRKHPCRDQVHAVR